MDMESSSIRIRDEFGPHLIGRDVGKRIRERYFSAPPDTWPRALDFSGVEQVTESCADELFGTLARREGLAPVRALSLVNRGPAVREAIEYVLELVEDPPPAPNREAIERLLGRGRERHRDAGERGRRRAARR